MTEESSRFWDGVRLCEIIKQIEKSIKSNEEISLELINSYNKIIQSIKNK